MINPKRQRKLDRVAAKRAESAKKAQQRERDLVEIRRQREERKEARYLEQIKEVERGKFTEQDARAVDYAQKLLKHYAQTPEGLLSPILIGFFGKITVFKSVLKEKLPIVPADSRYSLNEAIDMYKDTPEFKDILFRLPGVQRVNPEITMDVVYGMIKEIWKPKTESKK